MYIEVTAAPAGAPDLAAVLAAQAAYVQESLGVPILPSSQRPAEEGEELGREEHELAGEGGAAAQFTLVLTRPGGSGAAAVAQQLQQQGL